LYKRKKENQKYLSISENVEVQGKKFRSFRQACRFYGVSRCTVKQRLNKGWLIEEAFGLIKNTDKCFIVNNIVFPCFKKACTHHNLLRSTVRSRLDKGWSVPEAFELVSRDTNSRCNGKIYIVRNTVNSRVYVGITTSSLDTRFYQHTRDAQKGSNTKFHKAMRKHGFDKFSIELLRKVKYRKNLNKFEIWYINKYKSITKGYNTGSGGGSVGDKIGFTIEYKGTVFRSKAALANYLNMTTQALNYRLKQGIPLDQPIRRKVVS
jgi:hypothetical protein